MEAFEKFQGMNLFEFMDRFPDDTSCKSYLAHYKWEDGFVCPQCGCKEEHHSNENYTKRCKACYYKESATAGTLFHKVKFGLRKAFYIVFEMVTTTKSSSSLVYSQKLEVRQKTAWLFCQKVRYAMESSKNYPLEGEVEVDETYIGGESEGKRGRGAEGKTVVVIAIEKNKDEDGIKRGYAEVVANCSAGELTKIFEDHIAEDAHVKTDQWKGYLPIMKDWNIDMEKSNGGKNFELMHRFIMGLKSWIRGIFHKLNPGHLQKYLDEYCYRFNRSIFKETIFDKLIVRMVHHIPKTYKAIILSGQKLNA